jgi:hypothetical protein
MNIITSIIIFILIILQNGVLIIYAQIQKVSLEYPLDHKKIVEKVNLAEAELQIGKK